MVNQVQAQAQQLPPLPQPPPPLPKLGELRFDPHTPEPVRSWCGGTIAPSKETQRINDIAGDLQQTFNNIHKYINQNLYDEVNRVRHLTDLLTQHIQSKLDAHLVADLKGEFEQQKKRITDELKKIEDERKATAKRLDEQEKKAESDLKKEIDQVNNALQTKAKAKDLSDLCERVKTWMDDTSKKITALDAVNADHIAKLDSLMKDRSRMDESITTFQRLVSPAIEIAKDLKTYNQEIANLQGKVTQLESLQGKIKSLEDDAREAKREFANFHDLKKQLAMHVTWIQEHTKLLEERKDQITNTKELFFALDKSLAQLNEKESSLQRQVDVIQKFYTEAELSHRTIRRQIDEATPLLLNSKKIDDLQEEVFKLKENIRGQEEKEQIRLKYISDLETRLRQRDEDLEQLTQIKADFAPRLARLEANVMQAARQVEPPLMAASQQAALAIHPTHLEYSGIFQTEK